MGLLTLLCLLILATCLPAQELGEGAVASDADLQDVAVQREPEQPVGAVAEQDVVVQGQSEQPGAVVVEQDVAVQGEPEGAAAGQDVTVQGAPEQPEGVVTGQDVGEQEESELPEAVSPDDTLQRAPSGFVCPEREGRYPRPEQCDTFYFCTRGVAYVVRCQGGLHFSPTRRICENAARAECGVTTTTTTTTTTTPAPPTYDLPEVCLEPKPEENCGSWQYARYYYNPEMDRCFRFKTSCTAAGNNFPSLLACRKKCMTRVNPVCLERRPEGKCGGTQLGRYYFDPKLDQCVYFLTSCADNPSIFQSQAECTWTCHSEH